jgi:hypothetical protein
MTGPILLIGPLSGVDRGLNGKIFTAWEHWEDVQGHGKSLLLLEDEF